MPATINSTILPAITNVFDAMDSVGVNMIDTLSGLDGLGFKLLATLFAIMFFYNIIMFMLDGNGGQIMVDITKLVITFAVLSTMLVGWSSKTPGGGVSKFTVAGFFLRDIPDIAKRFSEGNDATPVVIAKHADSIMNLYKILSPSEDNAQSISEKFKDAIPIYGQMRKIFGWGEEGNAFDNAPWMSILVSTVLIVLAAIFIIFSMVTFVFVINAGTVMLYIGLALGPVLIPFLLIQKLSFLFDGWLRFMIAASLYKVVAVLVAMLTLGTVDAVVNYAHKSTGPEDSLIMMSLIILFFAMLCRQLMGLADNIASTIATGGANSGGDGGSTHIITAAAKTKI